MSNVVPLRRPAVPVPSSRQPASRRRSSRPDSVRVTLDDPRGVHLAFCMSCAKAETAYPESLGWLFDWADTHECDQELVELFTDICGRWVA